MVLTVIVRILKIAPVIDFRAFHQESIADLKLKFTLLDSPYGYTDRHLGIIRI